MCISGKESEQRCLKCGQWLPMFAEDGKHNFCPASTKDGGIINLCIKCKVEEVIEAWRKG